MRGGLFYRAEPTPESVERTNREFKEIYGLSEEDIAKFRESDNSKLWRNNAYTVAVYEDPVEVTAEDGTVTKTTLTHLSIKRNDRAPIHDWRDLQDIKNFFCGEEREGVEIYPAESRRVDTANQYHLWVLPAGQRVPFGFKERMVRDAIKGTLLKQRPFSRNK